MLIIIPSITLFVLVSATNYTQGEVYSLVKVNDFKITCPSCPSYIKPSDYSSVECSDDKCFDSLQREYKVKMTCQSMRDVVVKETCALELTYVSSPPLTAMERFALFMFVILLAVNVLGVMFGKKTE
jgi:hypothetical protein